jgi:hypothetical protein
MAGLRRVFDTIQQANKRGRPRVPKTCEKCGQNFDSRRKLDAHECVPADAVANDGHLADASKDAA